ncbi:MAG: twin-arginine translocase TatA/TatE family subunit [Actinomycetota bacterium]
MGWDNPIKILVILLLALLIFGAKRLPEIGRGLGKGLREFRDATKGLGDDVKSAADKPAEPKAEERSAEPPKVE